MDPEVNSTTAITSLMYEAIKNDNLKEVRLLLKRININEPIITTGEFAGFTVLHFACMKNHYNLVKLLVNNYKADVNVMAADGTQPLHLACFYAAFNETRGIPSGKELSIKRIKLLVKANANVDAEFGQEIFSKHVKDREWCPFFGNKMPLVAYTIIYHKPAIMYHLKNVNLDIISLENKTLLMHAVDDNSHDYITMIMSNVKDPKLIDKLINHRDNDDVPLTHYPFHPKKYGKFRYLNKMCHNFSARLFFSELSKYGADMYALINNDPATFLPNLAAYRGCPTLLDYALPYYTSMSLSKVLYYATLPIDEKSKHLINKDSEYDRCNPLRRIRIDQTSCIDIALKDLVFRGAFRLPVPEQEVKLMDELIASDENLWKIVDYHKTNFIEKELQGRFIEFGDNKMTLYDFLMQVFDDKKLKFLAREENLLDDVLPLVFKLSFDSHGFFETYNNPIMTRIKDAKERLRLFENLKKISSLREAIPLPFELVLDIVEYLNNKHFNVFIEAFYSS